MRAMGWLISAGLALASGPALAHHSTGAVYNQFKTVAIEGFLSKVEVANPHSMLEVTIPLDNGQTVVWQVESRGVESMTQHGFARGVVKVGDRVTVTGQPAWALEHRLWLVRLETSRGRAFEFEAPSVALQ